MAYVGRDGGAVRRAEVVRGASAAGAVESGGSSTVTEETALQPQGVREDAWVCCGMAM